MVKIRERLEAIDEKLEAIDEKLETVEERLHKSNKLIENMSKLMGPFGVYMGDGMVLTQTLHGVKFLVHADDLVSTPNMIVYRQWEAAVSRYLYGNLTPDSVFVDVGANFGYFSCLAGALIGDRGEGRVYAFEPNPELAELLRKNIAINWSMCPIEVIEAAAAEETGRATLYCPRARSANASLFRPPGDNTVEATEVPQTTLDERLPEGARVDLLKIDVEGAEYLVLKGATRVLTDNRDMKVIMEWSLRQIRDAGIDPQALLDLIAGLDFQTFVVDPEVKPLALDQIPSIEYANLMLARQ